jgi:hypothetical protein
VRRIQQVIDDLRLLDDHKIGVWQFHLPDSSTIWILRRQAVRAIDPLVDLPLPRLPCEFPCCTAP